MTKKPLGVKWKNRRATKKKPKDPRGIFRLSGWKKRFEPSTFGATIRCSIQLSYFHRRDAERASASNNVASIVAEFHNRSSAIFAILPIRR